MKKWLTVLVVMFVGLTISMNNGCKATNYDIIGAWSVDYVLASAGNFDMAFSGSRTTGYTIWSNQVAGEYNVADKDVEFVLRISITVDNTSKTVIYFFTGSFESKDRMSGTLKAYDPEVQGSEINGTWFAEKM